MCVDCDGEGHWEDNLHLHQRRHWKSCPMYLWLCGGTVCVCNLMTGTMFRNDSDRNFLMSIRWAMLHWIRRFAKVNANKVNICLWYHINSTFKLFLLMYTFIIYWQCVYVRNVIGDQNEQKEENDWLTDKHTNGHINQVQSHSRDLLKCI